MNTPTIAPLTARRGRPGGLSPSQYDHAKLLAAFNGNRTLRVRDVTETIGISHQHLYDILNGRVNATRDRIEAVAAFFGFDPADILQPVETILPSV